MMRLRKNSFDPVTLTDCIEMIAMAIGVLVLAVIVPNAVIYLLPLIGVAL